MRIAAIADIHGNALALEAVLADIARRGADRICNLGDHFSGPLEPGRTFSLLRAHPMLAIRGNHDRYVLARAWDKLEDVDRLARTEIGQAGLDWLAALPHTDHIGAALFACHGTPTSDKTHWLQSKDLAKRFHPTAEQDVALEAEGIAFPLIACGHSHVQRCLTLADGRQIFNPGSVGRPAYTMADPDSSQKCAPDAGYALVEQDHAGGWRVEMIQVPYDHEQAAHIARNRGATDWAAHLSAGWQR